MYCPVANRRVAALTILCGALASPVLAQELPETPDRPEAVVIEEIVSTQRYETDGTATSTVRLRVHVLTEDGRQRMGQLYFPFRDGLMEVDLRYLRTLKASGEKVEALPGALMEITAPVANESPVFSDVKFKVLPVPGLQVGDRIEYEVVTSTVSPLKPGDFWEIYYPTRDAKVLSEKVVLDLPADREVALRIDDDVEVSVDERDGRLVRTWNLSNPEPQTGKELNKRLYAVSTLTSWSDLGTWFRELSADREELTPELEALASSLVEGLEEPEHKLQAIYDYVSNSVRYVSLSLGIGGYQPHAAAETWRNQFGDCKDKHTLLAVLLRAAGMEVYPVLLNTLTEVEPDVPSPEEFDHVISLVTVGEEQVWLDATVGFAPLGYLPPLWRGERRGLLIDTDGAQLVEIPEDSPVPESWGVSMVASVDNSGSLEGHIRHEYRGTMEVLWRNLAMRSSPEEISRAFKFQHPILLSRAELNNPTTSDPVDTTEPFVVEYTIESARFMNPMKSAHHMRLPSLVLGNLPLEGPPEPLPESLGDEPDFVPLVVSEHLELTIGPAFDAKPPDPVSEVNELGSYEARYEMREGTLVVDRTLETLRATPSEAARASTRSLFEAVRKDRDRTIVFERAGELDVRAAADDLNAHALTQAGYDAYERGELDLAHELLTKAVEKDPEHLYAWNNLGLVHLARNVLDEAQACFEKQIELNVGDEFAHGNLAIVYIRQGKHVAGLEQCKRHVEINPDDPRARFALGSAYYLLEHWEESEHEYTLALELEPDDPGYLIGLGNAQLRLDKTEQALANFDRAVEISGEPGTYNDIAYALIDAGHEAELAMDYATSAVLRVVAELRLLSSLKAWRRNIELQSDFSAYLDTLGWIHFKGGHLDEAELCLTTAFELDPHTDSATHLATLHAARERYDEALSYYARSVYLGGERPVRLPENLEGYVSDRFGGQEGLDDWLRPRLRELESSDVRLPATGKLTWPQGAETDEDRRVLVVALVDTRGQVSKLEIVDGDPPWRTAAAADAQRFRFPPIEWDGRAMKTLRALTFTYRPERVVVAEESTALDIYGWGDKP